MSYQVRSAYESDVDWVVQQLKKFADFYGSDKSLFKDEEYASKRFSDIIKHNVVFVAEGDDGPVGFIAGFVHPHHYNPEIIVLSEMFWWVDEAHRKTEAGSLLLKEFIEYGKLNTDWIICTLEDVSPVSDDVFLKRGFKLKEKSFLMEVR